MAGSTKDERIRKRELAQYLFVNDNLSQKEIALKVGASENTVSKWVKDGKWDMLRSSMTITRQEQLSRLYDQIAALNKNIVDNQDGIPSSKDADILSKLSIAIRKLENEASIADIIEVSRRVMDWLRPVNPQKAIEVGHVFNEFINEQLKSR